MIIERYVQKNHVDVNGRGAFNAEVTDNQARTGAFMAMGSMLCVQVGLGDRRHPDRPHRRRGRRVAAAGLGGPADACHRPAPPGGVHAVDVLRVRGARRGDRLRHHAVHGRVGSDPVGHGQCAGVPWAVGRRGRPRQGPRPVCCGRASPASGSCCSPSRGRAPSTRWACCTRSAQRRAGPATSCSPSASAMRSRASTGLAVSMPVAGLVATIVVGPECVRADDPRNPADRNRSGDPAACCPVRAGDAGVAPTHHGCLRDVDGPRAGFRDGRRFGDPVTRCRVPAAWSASAWWSPRASAPRAPGHGGDPRLCPPKSVEVECG